jgi:small subunit ribosomal protein S6
MKKYEAMFILKPDLKEDEVNSVGKQINESIIKSKGEVSLSEIWSNKRKLAYPIKKYNEGIYYRVNFSIQPTEIDGLKQIFRLNENILRVLILKLEK